MIIKSTEHLTPEQQRQLKDTISAFPRSPLRSALLREPSPAPAPPIRVLDGKTPETARPVSSDPAIRAYSAALSAAKAKLAQAQSTAEAEAAEKEIERLRNAGPGSFSPRKLAERGMLPPTPVGAEGARVTFKHIVRNPEGLILGVVELALPCPSGLSMRDLVAQLPADLFQQDATPAPRGPGLERVPSARPIRRSA
jgi:hypothetical protein